MSVLEVQCTLHWWHAGIGLLLTVCISGSVDLHASTRLRHGCVPIGYSWTLRRPEFLWSTTSRRLHQLPQLPLRVDRLRPHFTSFRRLRSWNIHRQRCLNDVSRREIQGWNCRGGRGCGVDPPQCLQTLIFEWKLALNFNPWAKFQTFRISAADPPPPFF